MAVLARRRNRWARACGISPRRPCLRSERFAVQRQGRRRLSGDWPSTFDSNGALQYFGRFLCTLRQDQTSPSPAKGTTAEPSGIVRWPWKRHRGPEPHSPSRCAPRRQRDSCGWPVQTAVGPLSTCRFRAPVRRWLSKPGNLDWRQRTVADLVGPCPSLGALLRSRCTGRNFDGWTGVFFPGPFGPGPSGPWPFWTRPPRFGNLSM